MRSLGANTPRRHRGVLFQPEPNIFAGAVLPICFVDFGRLADNRTILRSTVYLVQMELIRYYPKVEFYGEQSRNHRLLSQISKSPEFFGYR